MAERARTLPDGRPRPPMTGSLVILGVGTVLMVAAAFFIWSWGTDDSAKFRRGYLALGPALYEQRLERGDPFVVNVDRRDSGSEEIDGTDVSIPYDKLAGHPDLPADKQAEILIYASTEQAAKTAAQTLRATGYEDIVDLRGGTAAWRRAGKPLVASGPEQVAGSRAPFF